MAKKNKNKKNKKDTQTVDASTENNTLPVYESSAQRDDDSSKGMPMWQRILIVIVILLLVGFGWWIFTSNSNSDNNSDSQNTEQASNSDNNSSNSSSNNNSSQNESTPTPTSSATSTPTATPTPTSSNNNSSNNNSNTDNNSVTPVTETDTQYDYTAASGDSMTLFVRRSMLSYLENKKIDLNASQKIYVETLLTQQYGSPRLKVGQKVSVLKSDLEKWVNNAKALSSSAQAKWAKYAALVNY